jgi:hypothetical protein
MREIMGVWKNKDGVYYVRKKVPAKLCARFISKTERQPSESGITRQKLAKGARLRVIEEDRRGPALKEWRPPKMCRRPGQLRPLDQVIGQVAQT